MIRIPAEKIKAWSADKPARFVTEMYHRAEVFDGQTLTYTKTTWATLRRVWGLPAYEESK